MSLADIAILAVIALCVFFALRAYKKGGHGSCGGDCANCRRACEKKDGEKK